MDIARILTPDRIRVPMRATDKPGLITELVDLLVAAGAVSDREGVLSAVLKRESERTTGIGYGLAIPHGKTTGVPRVAIAAGKPAGPIDFQSLDGRPVTFAVLLLSPPDQTGPHIQALARISRLMNIEDFRAAISRAASAEQLHATIAEYEAKDVHA